MSTTQRTQTTKGRPAQHSVAASRVETTHLVLPSHANTHGTLFGGKLIEWLDSTAAMAAMRHCRLPVVTASIDDLHFIVPIKIGHMAHIMCEVTCTGKTSMEVEANILAENPATGVRQCTCVAFLTFVAIDSNGKPIPVPAITPHSEDEKERNEIARKRKTARIAKQKQEPIECRLVN